MGETHLAGHALPPALTHDVAFPYLLLLVSGGHCQFCGVDGPDSFARLVLHDRRRARRGLRTQDRRLLALLQPGGPHVERAAAPGDPTRFALPRPPSWTAKAAT